MINQMQADDIAPDSFMAIFLCSRLCGLVHALLVQCTGSTDEVNVDPLYVHCPACLPLACRSMTLSDAAPDLESVVQQLTEANEHLALRAAKVSEAELQEVQQEATERLAAAERKVRIQLLVTFALHH
jgi:hypothetical protein